MDFASPKYENETIYDSRILEYSERSYWVNYCYGDIATASFFHVRMKKPKMPENYCIYVESFGQFEVNSTYGDYHESLMYVIKNNKLKSGVYKVKLEYIDLVAFKCSRDEKECRETSKIPNQIQEFTVELPNNSSLLNINIWEQLMKLRENIHYQDVNLKLSIEGPDGFKKQDEFKGIKFHFFGC